MSLHPSPDSPPRKLPSSIRASCWPLTTSAGRTSRPPAARQLRHQRPPRHVAQRHLHRGPHPGHHAGHLRLPRKPQHIDGPLFMGKDTHALSGPAQRTALEVLAANGVDAVIQRDDGFTPTPVISHAILAYNRGRNDGLADGIVITPSHNPPDDGGFKYNPPNGGPADTDVTNWIQDRANDLLRGGNRGVKRLPYEQALDGRDHAPARFRRALCRRPEQRHRHGRDPRRRHCASASIRSAARRRPTGSRSPNDYGLNLTVVNPPRRSDVLAS